MNKWVVTTLLTNINMVGFSISLFEKGVGVPVDQVEKEVKEGRGREREIEKMTERKRNRHG